MPKFTKSAAFARIGAGVVEICCAQAQQIWRETHVSDVGIDGTIEFVDQDEPTGIKVAVQIKTGSSYLNEDRSVFSVHSDQDHFK